MGPLIAGVRIFSPSIIQNSDGDVMHVIRSNSDGFNGFGEAYFSMVRYGGIKAWKMHRKMTLNLVVPLGSIRFVIYDDRITSPTRGQKIVVDLSSDFYRRLVIEPCLWVGFMGRGVGNNMLLNVADMAHDPREVERRPVEAFPFEW
jgi:dTDP-4-dehydrorhamnose 3,5-epimerase